MRIAATSEQLNRPIFRCARPVKRYNLPLDGACIELLKDDQPKDNYIIHKVKSPTKPKGE